MLIVVIIMVAITQIRSFATSFEYHAAYLLLSHIILVFCWFYFAGTGTDDSGAGKATSGDEDNGTRST